MNLTPDQKRAATADGSVAVTAGAGTGKTSMLAARYLHHVQTDGMSPLSVVAVTFTDKAADELRSRIRKTLNAELGDEKVIAEVEAAQISTMHALASRICRDFYDLADIPPDFSILDDTAKPLWMAEKFEEAVSLIDPEIFRQLGFSWLTSAISVLLKDPYSSEQALSLGADQWKDIIEQTSVETVTKLLSSNEWIEANAAVSECRGKDGDKLEAVRADVISAMANPKDIEALNESLKNFARNKGAAGNWPDGGLERLRQSLGALKDLVKADLELATLKYGPEDDEAARRIEPLAAAFRKVRDYISAEKLREKVLDFGDLEHYSLKILDHPEAVEHYRRRWHAFLVDEFQDTNPIQTEILGRLTENAKLTIVGDEKQAIYGFRGADIGVFSRVREEIVTVRSGIEVPLSLTFRTHHELVLTMNTIFEQVLGELHQELDADRTDPPFAAPHVHLSVVEAAKGVSKTKLQIIEARYIARKIDTLHAAGVPYRDIAVISRTWAPLDVYLGVLTAMKIPAVHAGGGSLLDTREALDIYALVSFLTEPNDDIPLVALLRSPFFAFSDLALHNAANDLDKGGSWWQVINSRPEFGRAVDILQNLLDARSTMSSAQVVQLADTLTGYGAVIANLPHGARRSADLRGMHELFRRLERQGRGDVFGTARFLRELIVTETEVPRPSLDAGEAVSLMTIHKAKGLEWPIVFIPDLARDMKSDSSAIIVDPEIGLAFQMESDGYEKAEPAIHKLIKHRRKKRDIEEARRLYYVAVTRARDKVILTATKEKGFAMDILKPGLDAAGIVNEIIPYDESAAIAPSPGELEPFGSPQHVNVEPVTFGPRELPVTALTTYSICPLRFKFQYGDGHPGLTEGYGAGMAIGSLAHLALELDIDNIEGLRIESAVSPDDHLTRALELAENFRRDPAFASVRSAECAREVPFMIRIDGVTLHGIADLVGEDFVVDYKTDSEMDPDEHRFQLWAYATALKKPSAYIAYLRHGVLHKFGQEELRKIKNDAGQLLEGIFTGNYEPKPSEMKCKHCVYNTLCDARAVQS